MRISFNADDCGKWNKVLRQEMVSIDESDAEDDQVLRNFNGEVTRWIDSSKNWISLLSEVRTSQQTNKVKSS